VAYAKLALKADLLPTGLPDDPWFQRTLRGLFPRADQGGVRRRDHRAPAAPRDHHQLGGQLADQPGRHHLRVPRDGGDRVPAPSRSPAPIVIAREVFGLADFVAAVEALDNAVPTQAQTRLYLEFRRLLDRPSGGSWPTARSR
jgi:glutamate dehydrogenase